MKKVYDDDGVDEAATQVAGSLVGPYRTGEALGSGAMANVVEAVHIQTGERVALKLLHTRCGGVSEVVARFIREGRALQAMNHPNIVRVIDSGMSDQGDAWLAMELLEGKSLGDLVQDKGRLAPQRAIHLLADVSKALATVHARGMVHRDIKPENIFVVDAGTADEHAKLIDFGVAHVAPDDLGDHSIQYTRVGSVLGSASFMSPEQLEGGETTPASDVFGLAVTLYECLTGQLPFAGDTMAQQLAARISGSITPLRKRVPDVDFPAGLDAFLVRALSKDPSKRPENGLELLRELNGFLEGPTPRSAPPTTTARGTLVLHPNDGGAALRAGSSTAGHSSGMAAASSRGPGSTDRPTALSGRSMGPAIGVVVGIIIAIAVMIALQSLHILGR